MATTLIRVFGLKAFDSVLIPVGTPLDVYMDDSSPSCAGTVDHVVHSLTVATSAMEFAATDMLQANISLDKVAFVSSSRVVQS
eukprot:6796488-Pyramimonas_sp.AAC.1